MHLHQYNQIFITNPFSIIHQQFIYAKISICISFHLSLPHLACIVFTVSQLCKSKASQAVFAGSTDLNLNPVSDL